MAKIFFGEGLSKICCTATAILLNLYFGGGEDLSTTIQSSIYIQTVFGRLHTHTKTTSFILVFTKLVISLHLLSDVKGLFTIRRFWAFAAHLTSAFKSCRIGCIYMRQTVHNRHKAEHQDTVSVYSPTAAAHRRLTARWRRAADFRIITNVLIDKQPIRRYTITYRNSKYLLLLLLFSAATSGGTTQLKEIGAQKFMKYCKVYI